MLETLIGFIKIFPAWLGHTVEVLIVALLFAACVLFLWGLFVGIRIVGGRANKIAEINLFPPSIKFRSDDDEEKPTTNK